MGLVAITPAAGFVHPASSLAIGFIGALACYGAVKLKKRFFFGVDDALDVFCGHGVGGSVGAILTGCFSSLEINPGGADGRDTTLF